MSVRPTDSPVVPPTRFQTLGIAASGMSAQRRKIDTIATNIANAETTRTEGGGPYRRRVVEVAPGRTGFETLLPGATPPGRAPGADSTREDPYGVSVIGVTEDATEGPRVYEPGHPDADADGYVRYPNVNVTQEMVDLMEARRLFEANATVFQAAKAILRRAMDI